MSKLTYRTVPCTADRFRRELLQHVCFEIANLEYEEYLGVYLPTCQKTYIYGQGEQPKFATALRDDLIFPETDQNFETLLVHFPAGYGREVAHADPLGVPKLVAQVVRDFVAFRLRSLHEEIAE